MWFTPKLQGTNYPSKRLEWLEDYAPELLEEYLKSPRKLLEHLDNIEQRALGAIYSMTEERGFPSYEAEAIALTDIVYPEVANPDDPRPSLSPEAQKKLERFQRKYLGL